MKTRLLLLFLLLVQSAVAAPSTAKTPILNGLLQSTMDGAGFSIINVNHTGTPAGNSFFPSDLIDWRNYAIDPTGATDSTAGLQAYINAKISAQVTPPGSGGRHYDAVLPPGKIKISGTIDLAPNSPSYAGPITLRGAAGGTTIFGSVNNGYLFTTTNPVNYGPLVIDGIAFINNGTNGGCIDLYYIIGGTISNCAFQPTGIGVNTSRGNIFTLDIISCRFIGTAAYHNVADPEGTPSSATNIGIVADSHTNIYGCDVTAFDEGVRMRGVGCLIHGGRFEENVIGVNLGTMFSGGSWIAERVDCESLSFEANDYALWVRNVVNGHFAGIAAQGSQLDSVNASRCGIDVTSVSNVVFEGCYAAGAFTIAAIRVNTNQAAFKWCSANSGAKGAPLFGGDINAGISWLLSANDVNQPIEQRQFEHCLSADNGASITDTIQPQAVTISSTTAPANNDRDRILVYNSAVDLSPFIVPPRTYDPSNTKIQYDANWSCRLVNVGTGLLRLGCGGGLQHFFDGTTTNGVNTLASGTARFTSSDVGAAIAGTPGIPAGATIATVTDASHVVMSANATATNPNTLLFTVNRVSTIDGQNALYLRQYEGTSLWSDGYNFFTTGHSGRTFKVDLTPTTLSSNVNDYNPTGLTGAFTLRIGGGAADRTITGLQSGRDGRVVRICNIGATNNLILSNQDVGSASANRFLLPANITVAPNDSIALQYDATSGFWRKYSQ